MRHQPVAVQPARHGIEITLQIIEAGRARSRISIEHDFGFGPANVRIPLANVPRIRIESSQRFRISAESKSMWARRSTLEIRTTPMARTKMTTTMGSLAGRDVGGTKKRLNGRIVTPSGTCRR